MQVWPGAWSKPITINLSTICLANSPQGWILWGKYRLFQTQLDLAWDSTMSDLLQWWISNRYPRFANIWTAPNCTILLHRIEGNRRSSRSNSGNLISLCHSIRLFPSNQAGQTIFDNPISLYWREEMFSFISKNIFFSHNISDYSLPTHHW